MTWFFIVCTSSYLPINVKRSESTWLALVSLEKASFSFNGKYKALLKRGKESPKHGESFRQWVALPLPKIMQMFTMLTRKTEGAWNGQSHCVSHRTILSSWTADKNLATFWSMWHCESAISFINCWKSKVRPAISNININQKWEVSNQMQLPPNFYTVALCILRMKQFYLQRDLSITWSVKFWSTAWGPCRWGQQYSRMEPACFA